MAIESAAGALISNPRIPTKFDGLQLNKKPFGPQNLSIDAESARARNPTQLASSVRHADVAKATGRRAASLAADQDARAKSAAPEGGGTKIDIRV